MIDFNGPVCLLVLYLLVINVAGIVICGVDKRRAIRHQWRIPEKKIFLIAVLGGSLGILVGMYGFRHKTKHGKFIIGIPMILLCQILLLILFIRKIIMN